MQKAELIAELKKSAPDLPVYLRAGWGPFTVDDVLRFGDRISIHTASIMRYARMPAWFPSVGSLVEALESVGGNDSLAVHLSGTEDSSIPFVIDVRPDGVYLDAIGPYELHRLPTPPLKAASDKFFSTR